MTPEPPGTPAAQPPASTVDLAEHATAGILTDLARARRGVVVDSPPGAGKSTLVVAAAARLASAGERVMVIAQTNEQVDDLTERLADHQPGLADRPCLRAGVCAIRPHRPAPAGDGIA